MHSWHKRVPSPYPGVISCCMSLSISRARMRKVLSRKRSINTFHSLSLIVIFDPTQCAGHAIARYNVWKWSLARDRNDASIDLGSPRGKIYQRLALHLGRCFKNAMSCYFKLIFWGWNLQRFCLSWLYLYLIREYVETILWTSAVVQALTIF